MTASPEARRATTLERGEVAHRIVLLLGIGVIGGLIIYMAVSGLPYYSLELEDRPLSPLHSRFRSSGTLGLRLGMLSLGMFGILFLYPLRKRWTWLSSIGNTRRWLNFHILFGITTPMVVTFHTTFKWQGVAGLAYWTMIAVALSGLVGRYIYAKIPSSLQAVRLNMGELEHQMGMLAERLRKQEFFRVEDLSPLLNVPAAQDIRTMNFIQTLWAMLCLDLARPFLVGRLRRRVISGSQLITTIGGLLPSHDRDLETIISNVRRQSRLRAAMAFLDRTERIFHLWHTVHRPFSISFVVLSAIHIAVALSIGF